MAGIWYRAGTVALTSGSKRVTGTGTSWLNQAIGPVKGNIFIGPDGRQYEIDEVLSNTTLDLVETYAGTTASGQAYKIVTPIRGTVAALATQVSATLQYAQGQYSNMSNWAASDLPADVPVILPDGVTSKNVPNLAKMNASINAKLTSTPQLSDLNVPSSVFGLARLNDDSAAAARTALSLFPPTRLPMIDWSKMVTAEQRSEQERQARREAEKVERQALIGNITVEVDGLIFQGDEVSQGRMLRRAETLSEGESVDWIMADNTVARVTAGPLKSASRAAVDEMGRIWIGEF